MLKVCEFWNTYVNPGLVYVGSLVDRCRGDDGYLN